MLGKITCCSMMKLSLPAACFHIPDLQFEWNNVQQYEDAVSVFKRVFQMRKCVVSVGQF